MIWDDICCAGPGEYGIEILQDPVCDNEVIDELLSEGTSVVPDEDKQNE